MVYVFHVLKNKRYIKYYILRMGVGGGVSLPKSTNVFSAHNSWSYIMTMTGRFPHPALYFHPHLVYEYTIINI